MKMTQLRNRLRVAVPGCVMALVLLSVGLDALSRPRQRRLSDSYSTLINTAAKAVDQKQYSVAIEKCDQAILIAPKRAPAYLWKGIALGYVYINRGENNLSRRNEAIGSLNKFLNLASKNDSSRSTAQDWIGRIQRPFPPKPGVTGEPIVTPKPVKTPKPIITPKPTATAEPTVTPEPTLTPAPGVSPIFDYMDPPLQPQSLLMEHSNAVGAVAFAPDGRTLASGSWKSGSSQVSEIKLWDVKNGQVLKTLEGHRKVKWNGSGPKPPFFGNWGQVNALAFSPNGRLLASGGVGGRVTLWHALTGQGYAAELVKETGSPDPPLMSLSFLSNKQLAGVRSDWKLMIWNIRNQQLFLRVLPLPGSGNLLCSSFSWDGRLVATGSDDGRVRVWTVPDGELAFQIHNVPLDEEDIPQQVTAIALAPDGQSVVSANYSHVYWNEIETDITKRLSLTRQQVLSLAYAPDSGTVAATTDKDVLLLDVSNVKAQKAQYLDREGRKLAAASVPMRWLAFSPTERILAGGAKTDFNNNGAVVLWR